MEPGLLQLIGGVLHLDRATFEAIEADPHGLRDALLVLLIAGTSETLGQCVVLILNRVSRLRFVVSLALGGFELALEALVWIASVWVVVGLFGVARPSFVTAARVIGIGYAPLVLGFLVFLPYLGPLIGRLLRVWVLLAVVLGVSVAFDLRPFGAAIAATLGFLARWGLLWVFGFGMNAVSRTLRGGRRAAPAQLAEQQR
jgi:hypothetical protein